MSRNIRTRAVAGLATAVATAGLLIVPAPAQAATIPGCVAAHLSIVRGGRESATSHRFDRFRITNTGTQTCRLFGYPTFRFRNAAGAAIGFTSRPAGVPAHVVVLRPGHHTRVTVGTVVPAVVTTPGACKPRNARSVDLRLAYRPHVYRLPIAMRVCTTKQYRPTSYPVGF
jgi:hypothetical protein